LVFDEISDLMHSYQNSPKQNVRKHHNEGECIYVPKILEREIKPNSESKEKKGSKTPMISKTVPLRKGITNENKEKVM